MLLLLLQGGEVTSMFDPQDDDYFEPEDGQDPEGSDEPDAA